MNRSSIKMKSFIYDKKQRWEFFTKKDLDSLYPQGYKVVGETSKKRNKAASLVVENERGRKLYYSRLGVLKKGLYRSSGFIATNIENEFVEYKKLNIIGLVIGLIIIVGLITSVLFMMNRPTQLDPNLKDYDPDIVVKEEATENSTIIPGFPTFKMYEKTDEIYMALGNPKSNDCYFQYFIVLEETKEELFSTDLVPPGKAVTTIKLPRKFESGTYPIIVKIRTFDLNDQTIELNGAEYLTSIIAYKRAN